MSHKSSCEIDSKHDLSFDAVFREIDELFEKKEKQLQSMLDSTLHAFLEQFRDMLEEELMQPSQKEHAQLFAEVTPDNISQTTSISHLYQKNLEIMSKMMLEIIQEALKNFTVV
ncbi:hypothetical protein DOS86_04860 [Anaplasma marginale]|uniref:hypothetical protein n=1 Tax=Anaplasma marginale TaxID=770 RepID=UPI000DF00996|nr:hypothetical protein [Anaplasma marginale]RCL19399.1 hypothetical protein DOS86_04860 [Anaplasma marginale]